jgi:Flp pilus assembly protein TadD
VRNTLGIGQYRAGLFVEAIGNLLACDAANRASATGPVLEDVAGLGLSYAALGRLDEARSELARLRALAGTPRYAADSPRRAWIDELGTAIAEAEARIPR